jgi:hypothetical protein
VEEYLSRRDIDFPVILCESTPGQINAQRTIIERCDSGSIVMLLDADIEFDEEMICHLWQEFISKPDAFIAYAAVRPLLQAHSIVGRLLLLRYADPQIFKPRRHLHGRAYIIRNWLIPDIESGKDLTDHQRSVIADKQLRFLDLHRGVLVDDIFLSCMSIAQHGSSSIAESSEATVYYYPPTTLKDLFIASRRTYWEIQRLKLLFPEEAAKAAPNFRRRIRLSRLVKLYRWPTCAAYVLHVLDLVIGLLVKIDYQLVTLGFKKTVQDLFGYCASTKGGPEEWIGADQRL